MLARLRECEARHKDPWLCIDELENTGIVWELFPIKVGKPPLGVLFNVWRRTTLLSRDGKLHACNWVRRPVSEVDCRLGAPLIVDGCAGVRSQLVALEVVVEVAVNA